MDLDRRQPGQLQRIPDRPGVVAPGAGVDDHGVGLPIELVHPLDELPLGVALKEARAQPQLAREAHDQSLQLKQAEIAVVARVAPVEHVEVDPVHHLYAVVRCHGSADYPLPAAAPSAHNSATAARTCASGTACPICTAPGRSTSTKGTSPCSRFLSRLAA